MDSTERPISPDDTVYLIDFSYSDVGFPVGSRGLVTRDNGDGSVLVLFELDIDDAPMPEMNLSKTDLRKYLLDHERKALKAVKINEGANTFHAVTPYEEVYGLHPRDFVFDEDGSLLPSVGFTDVGSAYEEPDQDVEARMTDTVYHVSV